MEKLPKNLPREVRRNTNALLSGWEEGGEDSKLYFETLRDFSKNQGIDLSNAKVLEVGSGAGVFLNYMRENGIDVIGVDARPRGNSNSPQVIARVEQLPFADNTFEVVVSSQIFDPGLYNQDENLMLQEIIRVLKPSGVYVGMPEYIKLKLPAGSVKISDPSFPQLNNAYKKL